MKRVGQSISLSVDEKENPTFVTYTLTQTILSCAHPSKPDEIWIHSHSITLFDMGEAHFAHEQWYPFWSLSIKSKCKCICCCHENDVLILKMTFKSFVSVPFED